MYDVLRTSAGVVWKWEVGKSKDKRKSRGKFEKQFSMLKITETERN